MSLTSGPAQRPRGIFPAAANPPHPIAALFGRLLLAAGDVYLFLAILYLALSLITGDRLWPVALLNNFTPWIITPSLFVAGALALARRWRRLAVSGIAVIVWLALYGGLFLPGPATACAANPTDCRHITVMTYNLGNGYTDPELLIEVVRSSGADVVVLQEVAPLQAGALDASLADEYPYRVFYPLGVPGKGILSRWPILEDSGPFYLQTPLGHQRVVLDVDGEPLTVINAHPPRPDYTLTRFYEVHPGADDDIAALAAMTVEAAPALLVGDFNTTDRSDLYRLVPAAGLVDSYREAGWGPGFTFPAGGYPLFQWPLVRIDFVWHTPEFRAVRAWVGPDALSDHLPLIVELVWTQP